MMIFDNTAFLYPAIFAFFLYGGRFLLFAGIAFFFTSRARKKPWGRAHFVPPPGFSYGPHIRRELLHSLKSLLIFAAINGVLVGYGLIRSSQMYFQISQYPLWWFGLSILVMIILHDTFFYWSHRLMHTKALFAVTHRLHHKSVYPTAFTAYSFNTLEIVFEALLVVSIIYLIPVHPLAFLLFQTISIAYNVYGHCGRELFPASVGRHWFGKWLNTSSLHAYHHRSGQGNYSFYFTFWDRLMGTLVETVKR